MFNVLRNTCTGHACSETSFLLLAHYKRHHHLGSARHLAHQQLHRHLVIFILALLGISLISSFIIIFWPVTLLPQFIGTLWPASYAAALVHHHLLASYAAASVPAGVLQPSDSAAFLHRLWPVALLPQLHHPFSPRSLPPWLATAASLLR